jgi:WD40 repeat protein
MTRRKEEEEVNLFFCDDVIECNLAQERSAVMATTTADKIDGDGARVVSASQVLPGVQRSSQRCTAWVQHEGRGYMAYGCHAALVIVSGTLKLIQYIPLESRVSGVHFSLKDAKLVACYGHKATVFVPSKAATATSEEPQWQRLFDIEEQRFQITAVRWLEGRHPHHQQPFVGGSTPAATSSDDLATLIVAGTSLCVYQWGGADGGGGADQAQMPTPTPQLKVKRDLGRPVSAISCSPDARFVATIGTTDCLVKVWYRRPEQPVCLAVNGSKLGCAEQDPEPFAAATAATAAVVMPPSQLSFSFFYLRHPATVLHITWRPTREGPHAPNVLMTTSTDGIVRLWSENYELDSMPTPVPWYETPRFHLCGTVPAGLGSLVEWVRTLQPATESEQQHAAPTAPASPKKKRRVWSQGYDPYDDEDALEEAEEAVRKKGAEAAPNPRNFFHTQASCPVAAKFSPAARKVGMAGSDWIAEFDRYGNVLVWKFKSVPQQMPTISLWAKTFLCGTSISAANTKAIIPISFAFSDSSPRSTPTALWLYVHNSAGMICWWTLTRTSSAVPVLLQAQLHSQLFGHRNAVSQIVSHPTLPWAASISSEQNIILWRLDDTKPFEHPYLLRDVCAIGQYSVLAWVPSGNLFMVTAGNAIFVYALDEPPPDGP